MPPVTRQIVVDEVASILSPTGNLPQTRLLIDSDGNAAVFVVGQQAPVLKFVATADSLRSRNKFRGQGVLPDGQVLSWRKRGSSCQYQLAKCQIKAAQLESRWV